MTRITEKELLVSNILNKIYKSLVESNEEEYRLYATIILKPLIDYYEETIRNTNSLEEVAKKTEEVLYILDSGVAKLPYKFTTKNNTNDIHDYIFYTVMALLDYLLDDEDDWEDDDNENETVVLNTSGLSTAL